VWEVHLCRVLEELVLEYDVPEELFAADRRRRPASATQTSSRPRESAIRTEEARQTTLAAPRHFGYGYGCIIMTISSITERNMTSNACY
jgi:hypothetical protein